jgi:hypothetical protein
VSLQAGNYGAIDDRRFWGAGAREGVLSGGSYQVTAAGSGLSVSVAASTGDGALVQGDSVTAQGEYFVPPSSGALTVTCAAADATNPRNDLVVLEVKDDAHDASGLNLARVRIVTGTPNGSAGLNDAPGANGTPALPSSCLLLAVVRVTAGLSVLTGANVSDRRPWAGSVPSYETSLPSPAADGQEVYYRADSTNGLIWHLRFRNVFNGGSATYPWEYVGGPPQYATIGQTLAQSNGIATNTFSSLGATSGSALTLTVPLIGTYTVSGSGAVYTNNGVNANVDVWMGFRANSTSPGLGDAGYANQVTQNYTQINWTNRVTVTNAADRVIELQFAQTGGTRNLYSYNRQLTIYPVRVA